MPINLTQNALVVLQRRYLKKDEKGRVIETPEEMFRRVSQNIAAAETLYNPRADVKKIEDDFFEAMANLEFLPNSPTLMNAGRRLQQLAACFVLPVEDSLDSIFTSVKNTALIHQSGGGTGFSFSRLRPSDDIVSSTGGSASGPVSFMRVFNSTTEAIKQGGARRGANMGVLRVDHPDILQFITVKEDPAEFTNFNLSVAVTDAFMKAREEDGEYALVNPRTGRAAGRLRAREVFRVIAECAWKSGEPGLIFIDRIEKANPTPHLGHFEATNPCGEQPLLSYEPCNLGSINLGRMVKENGGWSMDWEKLGSAVALAVRFLDNVIEMSKYPTAEIDAMAKGNRKTGLGVMGFADLLVRLRMRYGSDESNRFAGELMRFISEKAWETSRLLATERGPFPNIRGSVFDAPGALPVRNATVTTIAPTGTLSIIAGCSSGIEPFFSLSYVRQVLNGVQIPEVNPLVGEVSKEEGFYNESLIEHISRGGDIKDRDEVPEHIKDVFVTAYEILPEDHIKMQAAFQKYTDNAVSKTINLPPEATVEEVRQAYMAAWRLGCKGITVYRSGTRAEQVLQCKSPLYC